MKNNDKFSRVLESATRHLENKMRRNFGKKGMWILLVHNPEKEQTELVTNLPGEGSALHVMKQIVNNSDKGKWRLKKSIMPTPIAGAPDYTGDK